MCGVSDEQKNLGQTVYQGYYISNTYYVEADELTCDVCWEWALQQKEVNGQKA